MADEVKTTTITKDAFETLIDVQDALEWLAEVASNERIGLAVVMKGLANIVMNDVLRQIAPLGKEDEEGKKELAQ